LIFSGPCFKKEIAGEENHMNDRPRVIIAICLIVLITPLITSCAATKTRMMVDSMNPLMEQMALSINKNVDVDMVRDAYPANLIQLDGLIEASPYNTKLLLKASEAYFGYSFAFIEDTDEERAKKLYLKSKDYALRVLEKNRKFRRALNGPMDEFVSSLETFQKEDVPALFRTSTAWIAWIAINLHDPAVLLDLPKVEAIWMRILELDETYYYGSTHASLGAYFASQSMSMGGDPEKAKYHFDRAFEISESKLLVVHLMYAQYYAYQIQDRKLYTDTLEQVLSTPENFYPELNLINEIAKRKARTLLDNVDMYF
jgi:tetratricopeptide (TPR) repeat protein